MWGDVVCSRRCEENGGGVMAVHAWCRLCLLLHHVDECPFIRAPKPRIAAQKRPRPCTKSCAIQPADVEPRARLT